jgi:hypothetical protein
LFFSRRRLSTIETRSASIDLLFLACLHRFDRLIGASALYCQKKSLSIDPGQKKNAS